MSAPQTLTYEQLIDLFRKSEEQMKEMSRETDRKMQETDRLLKEMSRETDRKMQETDRKIQETNRQIASLGDRIGEIVESMIENGVVRLFRGLGYSFTGHTRHYEFENKALGVAGEIDFFLENGDYALLVEVKTHVTAKDIKDHLVRVEKYRKYADARHDRRRFMAAIGGGVIRKEVQKTATQSGLYVIRQSGENVEIIEPDGKPKLW